MPVYENTKNGVVYETAHENERLEALKHVKRVDGDLPADPSEYEDFSRDDLLTEAKARELTHPGNISKTKLVELLENDDRAKAGSRDPSGDDSGSTQA